MAFPSSSSTLFTLGAAAVYKTSPIIGFGAFIQRYSVTVNASSDEGSVSTKLGTTLFGAEGNILFSGSLKDFIVGLRMGLMTVSTQATVSSGATSLVIDTTPTRFFVAPKVAYDYFLGRFSVGGEALYYIGFTSNASSVISVMGAGKFWF